MLESFTLDTFTPHVDDTFWIRLPEARVETRLTQAQAWGGGEAPRSFSLVFVGPARFVLPQQTYRLEHETLGEMDLFLVPIGPDGGGMRYEAVFS
jgi:hypothetical protein